MRELAEVDTVFEHLVDLLEEVSLRTTVGAALLRLHSPTSAVKLGLICYLQLAVLAEELVALGTLFRFEGKLRAHHTLDLFNHFSLQFVLDL